MRRILFYVFSQIHFGSGDEFARGWINFGDEVLFAGRVNNEQVEIVLVILREDGIHIFDQFGIAVSADI